MSKEEFQEIRDKDHAVLQAIKEGRDDIQKITAETTLKNHEVNYCFTKLEELDLIQVTKPDKMVKRVIDGQKRVFQHPKQAELTEKGEQHLEHGGREDPEKYEDLSHRELVEKVYRLENEVQELQAKFKVFRQQVMDRIQ